MTGAVAGRVVVVGGSWGGIAAMRSILPRLDLPTDAAVALVLHRRPTRSELANVLARTSRLPVEEVEDKAALVAGRVHLAPPDYHLLVEPGWFALSTDEPVRFSRPSIDVLFTSAAEVYGPSTVAVVLTGASDDGTDGARAVRRHGGKVIVEDPATAEQPIMPRSVIEAGAADHVVPIDELPPVVGAVTRGVPSTRGIEP
jgi:two-component system chemotaxis response regulator CheB